MSEFVAMDCEQIAPPMAVRGSMIARLWLSAPLLVAIILAGLHLFPSSAHADPEPGSRIDTNRGAVGSIEGNQDTVRVMNSFGRCIARNRPRIAETVLALPIRSEEQNDAAARLVGGEDGCLGIGDRELRFHPALLAGAMAEQLFEERFRTESLAALANMPDERLAEIGLAPRSGYEDAALCVVRRDPDVARAIISTRPGSNEERLALNRIAPQLGPCLPAGQTLSFSYPTLRSLLANGLYRMMSVMTGHRGAH